MIEKILELDTQLFLWFNAFHHPNVDAVMLFFSNSKVWIPLYIFIIYYLIKNFGLKSGAKFTLLVIIAVGLSDFVTSGLMKPYFMRLRPCHSNILGMTLVGNCGGSYGFASSHAANSFAFFTSIYLIFGRKKNMTILLFVWTIIVSYSRIYLGVHFPLDVMAGGSIGIIIANLIFQINLLTTNEKNRLDIDS